ncbi:hypothetical protein Air01nite_29810 [Asanoa iriomotensis]|uniref:Uncharacterized protein n=1 Tax=Asanoa iriomotensis TaxID=234613 RepID=A0ABQ4C279_9ACTN|nr:hypothetical protein Air01nite_29810 [Asanoa iriomotensis]
MHYHKKDTLSAETGRSLVNRTCFEADTAHSPAGIGPAGGTPSRCWRPPC